MCGSSSSSQLHSLDSSLSTAEPHCVVFFVVFLSGQLHLSFSLSTGGEDGLKEQREKELIPVQSLNLLLKSIGATLTDVQDVVFKYTTTRCCWFFFFNVFLMSVCLDGNFLNVFVGFVKRRISVTFWDRR